MRVRRLKHKKTDEWLKEGIALVEEIHNKLRINPSRDHKYVYQQVLADLEEMGYDIGYDEDNNILFNEETRQSIPSTVICKKIFINVNFPEPAQYEALFHEYIHIKAGDALSAIEDIINDKGELHNLENLVDITAYILTMPLQEMMQNLLKNGFKINKMILEDNYKYFEKTTVLQWISINSHLACHFAWVLINENMKPNIDYDNYTYDHKINPQDFKIDSVLKDPRSTAAEAVRSRKYAVNRKSFIGNEEHQCYAYYEKGLNRAICNVKLDKKPVQYDRLVVLGWKTSDYNTMIKS